MGTDDIIQADRDRACDILEKWGGKDNVQVVHDTEHGLRDHEDGYAGDLVRAFRDHRLAASTAAATTDNEGRGR